MATANSAQIKVASPGRALTLFISIAIGATALTWLLKEPSFTTDQTIVLFLGLFAVGLWITEVVPPFAVALMIMASLVFTLGYDGLTPNRDMVKVYTDTFSSNVVWLLLGGFFLAASMTKTGLDKDLINFSMKVCGTNPRWILFGMMTVTMIASMLMSNTTTTVMVISALMPLVNQIGKGSPVSKALILGIPIAATTGGMATLIGSPTNILASAAISSSGFEMDFLRWMVFGLPVAIVLTYASWWMLSRLLIKDPVEVQPLAPAASKGPVPGLAVKRLTVLIVLVVCLVAWLTSPLHGLSATAVSAVPLVILPLAGILKGEDIRGMGWDTLILVAGGLAMGEGLLRSGLMNVYASQVADLHIPSLVLTFAIAYTAMALSNVMSNPAACAILLPFGQLVLPDQVVEISMIIALASSSALFLPVSTPPNAIAYSTGVIVQKDLAYGGVFVGILGPLLAVLWVLAVG